MELRNLKEENAGVVELTDGSPPGKRQKTSDYFETVIHGLYSNLDRNWVSHGNDNKFKDACQLVE